jgi:hypothetical protein
MLAYIQFKYLYHLNKIAKIAKSNLPLLGGQAVLLNSNFPDIPRKLLMADFL